MISFESEDKLVFARTPQGRFVLNMTMKELEERLDAKTFYRVHKQTIVQLAYAREVHSLAGGHFLLKLSDGSETQIGRNYVKTFRTHFRMRAPRPFFRIRRTVAYATILRTHAAHNAMSGMSQ